MARSPLILALASGSIAVVCWLTSCAQTEQPGGPVNSNDLGLAKLVNKYSTVRLEAPLDSLSANQRQILALLIDAAREMDAIFWKEAYGDRDA